MGAPETIDYEAVLADLRARRDRLDATIAGIEQIAGISRGVGGRNTEAAASTVNGSAGGEPPESAEVNTQPHKLESDTFFGLSAVEGAKKYLSIVKRPAPMVAIHDALKAGGYLTNSQNFYSNLYTAIQRSTEFQKVGKNWGLAEWYVGRRMPGPPPTPRKKRKKKAQPKVAAKVAKKAAAKTEANGPAVGVSQNGSGEKATV